MQDLLAFGGGQAARLAGLLGLGEVAVLEVGGQVGQVQRGQARPIAGDALLSRPLIRVQACAGPASTHLYIQSACLPWTLNLSKIECIGAHTPCKTSLGAETLAA